MFEFIQYLSVHGPTAELADQLSGRVPRGARPHNLGPSPMRGAKLASRPADINDAGLAAIDGALAAAAQSHGLLP